MRRSLLVLALVMIAGCGGASDTTPATGPTSPTTTSVAATPVTTTDVAPDTTPATTSPPSTTATSSVPPDTAPPPPTTTVVAGDGVLGRPDPTLLEALAAETIPWDEVGPDWLAFAYPRNTTTQWEETGRQGLYLVDPDDRIYAVSALPIDGTDVVEVSWGGRIALLRGPYSAGLPLTVLDLETTIVHEVVPRSEDLDRYVLTRDGAGLWIYDLPWSNRPADGGTASVTLLDLTTLARTTVLEEDVPPDPLWDFYNWWVNNRGGIAELPSGEIVAGMPSGVWVSSPDGSDVRPLDLPDAACAVDDTWNDTTVQVRCQTTKSAQCEDFESELWLVPVDGRAPSLLAAPDADDCVSYSSAVPLADHLAIDAGFGSGECNGHVLVMAPDGTIERWVPPLAEVDCNEWVVGVRDGAWLVQAANPYVDRDFPIAVFEVTPAGAHQIDLPAAWVMLLTP
jgi:hypothetical protein